MIAALGLFLAGCKRQAPAPKTDLDRFQGTWQLVSATQDGNVLPEDKVKQTTIVFKGDTFRFPGLAEYATSKAGTVKLDETTTPKEMDAISTDKEVMLGIYVLQTERLQSLLCPSRQAASHRIRFHAREWPNSPILGAAEQGVTNYRQVG